MATLRDIRRRIRSIRSTAQITKTMEMVSAAKLRRAQTTVESARPYATQLREVLGNLAQASGDVLHPAFLRREVVEEAVRAGVDDGHLALHRERPVLALLQDLHHALAAGELGLRRLVEVRAELRERRHFAIL